MTKEERLVCRHHRLRHIGDLQVADNVFEGRFATDCATSSCKGECCKEGVWVDVTERDAILANAEAIISHMDSGQQAEPARWFESDIWPDTDFPSGRCVGTELHKGACVFLDGAGLCVLQKASQNRIESLKPFLCVAFPIAVAQGSLCIDEGYDACCTLSSEGIRDIFDVCDQELRYVLGDEGVAELRHKAKMRGRATP